jgi:signal peptidase I
MKKTLLFLWEIAKIVVISLVIVLPIRYFVFQPFLVRGESMEPNFQDGDYLIIDEISYRLGSPERGDVIVFNSPTAPSQRFIKRIIGLPGETVVVEDGMIKVLDKEGTAVLNESEYLSGIETPGNVEISLGEEEYFVLGDNRVSSYDSRRWGPLQEEEIIGKVSLRAWPVAAAAAIKTPEY